MIRARLAQVLQKALASLQAEGVLPDGLPAIDISEPREAGHGDFACNFALVAAKQAGRNPRELAQMLIDRLPQDGIVASAEIAGPGFINIRLRAEAAAQFVGDVLRLRESGLASAHRDPGESRPNVNIEFVSVNPNGPITVGSGRGAAFGSTLANVLEAAGYGVHREYYINDGVNSEQMRQFAESVRSFVEGLPFPEQGYKGDYVQEVADEVKARYSATSDSKFKTIDLTLEDMFIALKVLSKLLEYALIEGADRIVIWAQQPELPEEQRRHKITLFNGNQEKGIADLPFEVLNSLLNNLVTDFETDYRRRLQGEPVTGYALTETGKVAIRVHHADWKSKCEFSIEVLKSGELGDRDVNWYQAVSQSLMLARQKTDLASFGVEFDTWFSEQSLHDSGIVERDLADLEAKGAADREPIRHKLKLGKGGVVEDVEIEPQSAADEEEEDLHGEPLTHRDDSVEDVEKYDPKTDQVSSTLTSPHEPSQATLWLRSTKFGDDMDRVLRRSDGRLTYIASDVAYHKDKFNRGTKPGPDGTVRPADKLITVLGPDHHGYIGRLHAVVGALLENPEDAADRPSEPLSELDAKLYRTPQERDACRAALEESRKRLEVVIFQIVRFVKDGKPAPMRKRDGNIYSLRDLMSEIGRTAAPDKPEDEQLRIGKDVARFFYLMRSHDTHMDFDIDLATKQTDENPVFYCQYAHARICSVVRKAEEAGIRVDGEPRYELLIDERELALIKKICDLPFEVDRCAADYGVHRLTTYAQELARTYHHFYDGCRVIQPEHPELSKARLALCEAAAIGLRSVLDLLGVSAPESM